MADYDVQRTLWTDPAAAEGMWNAAKRCWELSASTETVVNQRAAAYQQRLEDIAGQIDEVQQQLDQLPIDSPERPALEAKKAQLQTELAAQQDKKDNLTGLSAIDMMWKGNVDKRDVLAILENSVMRQMVMHDAPKDIRRDPGYRTISGYIPVLSTSQDTVQKWCAVQDQDGNWTAQQQDVHPLVEGRRTISSQVPMLSTSLIDDTLSAYVQAANVFPSLDTHTIRFYSDWHIDFFSPWTALCAITMPANMNSDAIVTHMRGTAPSSYEIGLSARYNGWFWPGQVSLWLDNSKAFNNKISDLQYIGNSDLLETAGWGSNGHWISGLTALADQNSRLTASTGVDFQKAFAEWYNLRSRYIGIDNTMSQPQIFIVNNYYDIDFISAWHTNFRTLGEFDYSTGDPISSFWGIFQPETPSVWPRNNQNNIAHTSPDSMDIYTSYWNLSKMDHVAHWIPYNQAQIKFQITGNSYVETPDGRQTHNIMLSDGLSGIPDFQWMFSWGNNTNWENFETYAFDPYTELTRKKAEGTWTTEEGCRFRGTAVGNWAQLSGSYDHATCWYWNDMFDRYGDVLGAWYIVPVAGYSAAWKEWYDNEELKTMVRFSDLDVKISLFAVRADTAQDQTTKSWRAYMGDAFWRRINQIYWDNCMPAAPAAPVFPSGDDPTRPVNYSLRSCKCLGPTMLVVKYRWRTASDDDGVHYIPLDLPRPKYTWQKPWEQSDD